MAEVLNLKKLQQTLKKMRDKVQAERGASVTVGFTMNYAVHVHENMTANHNVGQAKYLEQPARQLSNSGKLGEIVHHSYKASGSLRTGLFKAGIELQGEAQRLTPVDTSALKSSAFTAFTEQEDAAAAAAFHKGMAIRKAEESRRTKMRSRRKI